MNRVNNTLINFLKFIFWVAFIALCIATGALFISFIVSLFSNPEATKDLYLGLDLSELYHFNKGYYVSYVCLLLFISGLKAYMVYFVLKLLKKFDLKYPFHPSIIKFFLSISYMALVTAILALITNSFQKWMLKFQTISGLKTENVSDLLLFAAIIYVFALIFKRGSELQKENDLTV